MDLPENHILNPNSPVPLYRQLADIILAKIRAGDYPEGSKIPAEHTLARAFKIGRPTVRQATEFLVRRKMLSRRRGAGTFVRMQHKEVDLFSFAGTIQSFQQKGIPVTTDIIVDMKSKTVSIDPENPFYGSKAFFFSRLSRVEETPVLIEDIYLDPNFFPGLDRIDMTGRSLSQIADERYYMRPIGGNQNFRIVYPGKKQARLLDVSQKKPVLLVKRFLHFPQAKNIIYAELVCRTDRFVFSQTIGGIPDED